MYGDPQVHPQPETYWGNVNPIGPRGVYDEAKRYSEAMTMAYHGQQGVDTAIVDMIRDRAPQLHPKVTRDGVVTDPVEEIVANKICALLGRAEVRDLVDLYFLERAGHRVEDFLGDAQQKDAGVTPAALAWVLSEMVVPDAPPGDADRATVQAFARDLEARLRRLAVPVP